MLFKINPSGIYFLKTFNLLFEISLSSKIYYSPLLRD